MSNLSEKSILSSSNGYLIIRPPDYYNKLLDLPGDCLSSYCLSYLSEIDWELVKETNIILDGWVIYKSDLNDIKKNSDEWFLLSLKKRFNIIDLCTRAIYRKQ